MAPTIPKNEIGHGVSSYGNASGYPFDQSEWSPELQWPLSIVAFDKMRREDAQVQSVLRAVTLPIRRTQWRIDPNGARDEVVQLIADDLGLAVKGERDDDPTPTGRSRSRGRFSWDEHLRMALLCLSYGHMPFELICGIDPQGQARLTKLAQRMPATIGRINVDRAGELISIEQYPSGMAGDRGPFDVIPANRLVYYCHEREAGLWQGSSILRAAYKNWLLKDRLTRVDAMKQERNGMGIPIVEAPPNSTPAQMAALNDLAQKFRAGDASGGAIPNGARLTLMGTTGTLPDTLGSIKYHDEQIARSVLAQFLELVNSTHGSRALATSMIDFFIMALQATADEIADTVNGSVIETLVDLNWGEDEVPPQIVCGEIGDDHAATAESIAALVTSGALKPDDSLDAYIRQNFRMPELDPNYQPPAPPVHVLPTATTPPAPGDAPPLPQVAAGKVVAGEAPADRWAGAKNLTRIIKSYSPRLAQASSGLLNAKQLASKWAGAHQVHAAAPVDPTDPAEAANAAARAFLAQQAAPNITNMVQTLTDLYADSYAAGIQAAKSTLGQATDWSTWKPGYGQAAREAWGTDGGRGLQGMLDQAQVTIKAIADSRFDELADTLGQSLNEGWSNVKTAAAIRNTLNDPSRAEMIARTETARAMTVASTDEYKANDVTGQAWLLSDGACPLCEENESVSPIGIDDEWPNGDVPVHPNCVCAIAPAYLESP